MRKPLSLFVAALMIVSIFPAAVFAAVDEDVQAVYDALTEEMLTVDNEPEGSVTKSLNLDLTDDITVPDGVTVSFASSDASVIADDGTVTRDTSEKKDVTVTATIAKDGSDTLTKSLCFTVLPLTHKVIASDNLYYPQHVNKALVSYETGSAVNTVSDWTLSHLSQTIVDSHFDAKFLKDSSGYYNATGTRLTGTDACWIKYAPSSVPDIIQTEDDKSVTLTMNFNPVQFTSTSVKQFYLHIYGKKSGADALISYVQFWNDRTRICQDTATNTELFKSTSHVVKEGEDNEVSLKLDYNSGLMYLYLNGTLVNSDGTAITNADADTQISYITFGTFRTMTDSVMQINDIAITKQTTYCVSSVSEITAEMLANGQSPDFITKDLLLPANSDITYVSSNPDVISNEGVVIRPDAVDADVTLTATDANGSTDVSFTVKSKVVSQVAINDAFSAPIYDPSLNGTAYSGMTTASYATAKYANSADNYYLDYSATKQGTNSYAVYSTETGTSFPVGSSGKYVYEFDACCDSNYRIRFAFTGNGSDVLSFYIPANGRIYFSNPAYHTSEDYGDAQPDGKTKITPGEWFPVKFVINTLTETPTYELTIANETISTGDLEGATFDTSLGLYIRARYENLTEGEVALGVKMDNFRLYTEITPEEATLAATNAANAQYISNLITYDTITSGNYYDLENDLTLNAPLSGIDLEEMNVSVDWTSSDASVIANDGTVTRKENNRYVVMTVKITAGEGEKASIITKSFPYTVAAADSSVFNSFSYDFESYTAGENAGWTTVSNASNTVAQIDGRSGKVLQSDFTAASGYAHSTSIGGGTLTNRYFISADVCFAPDSTSTKQYVELIGAGRTIRIGFYFSTGGISLKGDNRECVYTVPGVKAETSKWYHIDMDFNAAKKCFTAYVNGVALSAEPCDIDDNLWFSNQPVKRIGIYSYGTGKAYMDNVVVRQSNSAAPVYDANSDYTIRNVYLTNQNGSTITNASSTTTAVNANVKIIKNRTVQDGEARVILARYNLAGKLEQLVSQEIATTNEGQIMKLTMALEGDCSDSYFKIFAINSGSITPIVKNFNSVASKFDAERLFSMDTNVEDALELGYEAESEYEGIDAIIYDGDTWLGKKTRHFAYIGLPEGASADNPVPAVVCVHGGGGTAYDEWVKKWNDHGYAAIAMNLNGRIPSDAISNGNNQLCHAWPGASQDNYGTTSPDDATWMYSAVTAVIAAHNVLREMPEVDNSKIGIIGVSWGGVVTSTTIGVDDRFAFAIPAYGCGFLYGSETYMANAMSDEEKLWDASMFIGKANLPILWMNGDGDWNFSLTSTTKSALLAGDNSYPCIIPNFAHSHSPVWNRAEGYAFADSVVNGGTEFVRGDVTISGSTATVKTNRAAVSATMYYTTSDTFTYNSTEKTPQFSFSSLANSESDTDTFTFEIPSDAKKFYIVFADENGYSTSTVLYDVE